MAAFCHQLLTSTRPGAPWLSKEARIATTFIERRTLRSDISSVDRQVGHDPRSPVTCRIRVRARLLPVAGIFAQDADFKAWFAGL